MGAFRTDALETTKGFLTSSERLTSRKERGLVTTPWTMLCQDGERHRLERLVSAHTRSGLFFPRRLGGGQLSAETMSEHPGSLVFWCVRACGVRVRVCVHVCVCVTFKEASFLCSSPAFWNH